MINDYEEFLKARESLMEYLRPKIHSSVELFSVVHNPLRKREQNRSNLFEISLYGEEMSEFTQESTIEIESFRGSKDISTKSVKDGLSMTTLKRKSKKTKSKTSSIAIRSKGLFKDDPPISIKFESRYVLNPNETLMFQIRFLPKNVNLYENSFGVEIVGWNTRYNIDCVAICDIPRINMDPAVLFANVIDTRIPKYLYENNFFVRDEKIFDFGNCLVNKPNGNELRIQGIETPVHLQNISNITGEVSLCFEKDDPAYQLQPNVCQIEPNNSQYVVVNAIPNTLGQNYNKMFIIIKDNPKVEIIDFVCKGCELKFDLSSRKIVFERVQLDTLVKKHLDLLNNSEIPLLWKFDHFDNVLTKINIIPLSGRIKPNSKNEVTFSYMSKTVEDIKPKKLIVLIFDEYNPDIPLLTDSIEISAEACELNVIYQSHIDFSDVKARQPHSHIFSFQNVGKYHLYFEIEELQHENTDKKTLHILNMFRVSTKSGNLPPNKTVTTTITFEPNRTLTLKDFPIFKCKILDVADKNAVRTLQSFCITASAKTHFSTFEVHPLPDLNFGPILVTSSNTDTMLIKNNGMFEFQFNVLSKAMLDLLKARLEKSKGGKSGQGVKGSKASSVTKKSSE